MARAKLGTSSSLAAARLLADVERYQPLVPQPSDLSSEVDDAQGRHVVAVPRYGIVRRSLAKGSIMIFTLCLIALVAQDGQPSTTSAAAKTRQLHDVATRKVDMDEAAAFIRPGFYDKDADHSGYLDAREVSRMEPRDTFRDRALPPAPPPNAADPAAERKWVGKMDTDRDGKVSEEEYIAYLLPWILYQGVPADWHPP